MSANPRKLLLEHTKKNGRGVVKVAADLGISRQYLSLLIHDKEDRYFPHRKLESRIWKQAGIHPGLWADLYRRTAGKRAVA